MTWNPTRGGVPANASQAVGTLSDLGSEAGITLDAIAACVERVTAADGFTINTMAYQSLLVHIAIALMRIRHDCYVPIEQSRLGQIRESREFGIAYRIAEEISKTTGVWLPEEEIAYISIHLAGKQTILAASEEERGLVISDEVWSLVTRMLDRVRQAFCFDFRQDLELRMNLGRHIVPLAVRLQYRMTLKNPILDDVKARYPLGYLMALDASTLLAEHYDATVPDDEVGYIALAFALAIERQRDKPIKKRILMVCASGTGSARLLEYRCMREFGDSIESIETCDVLHINQVDFSAIDYVFTTVPIDRELPVPVREVGIFLDNPREIECVKDLLWGEVALTAHEISSYFDDRLFFPHLSATSKGEVLNALIDRVCSIRSVAADFRELVWEREEMMATSFGNMVAMPHPLRVASDDSFICVGILDRPMRWDELGHDVQVVFLASFNADGNAGQHGFLELLSRLLVNAEGIESIIERRDLKTLLGLLGCPDMDVGAL